MTVLSFLVAGGLVFFAIKCMRSPEVNVQRLRDAFRTLPREGVVPGMRFMHDCDICKPIQQIAEYDLYLHEGDHPSLVARYGDEPENYLSGSDFWLPIDECSEARVFLSLE